jgi:hypothetical protein
VNVLFDFNEAGREYQYLGVSQGRADFGMLSAQPHALFERLHMGIGREYQTAPPNRQRQLLDVSGCLHRLEGFLFQTRRVSAHATSLTEWIPPADFAVATPEGMVVLPAREACFEFEDLLFQARAALDRLTAFISAQHGQRCNRFTSLNGLLGNFARSNEKAARVLELLRSTTAFDGVLVDAEQRTSLRSKVAHYSSIPEGRQIAFTIHLMAEGKRLIFDCEALGRPLLGTSEVLSVQVPFVVLNALAIYNDVAMVTLDDFEMTWSNPAVSFSKYRDATGTGPRFTVGNLVPGGFRVSTECLQPTVLERAVSVQNSR